MGVAGRDDPDWKGVLYPHPGPRGFDPIRFLARYLDLIDIHGTFYRPPPAASPSSIRASWTCATRAGTTRRSATGSANGRRHRERRSAPSGARSTGGMGFVFDNHHRAQAVVNALQFGALLEGEPPASPERLVSAYPDALLDCTIPERLSQESG